MADDSKGFWIDFEGKRRWPILAPIKPPKRDDKLRRFCFHCGELTQFFRTHDGEHSGLPECVDCVRRIYGTALRAEPQQKPEQHKPQPKPPEKSRPERKAKPLAPLTPNIFLSGVALPALYE